MSEDLEATRRNFLKTATAVTVNPLNPDISGLSELENAVEESGIGGVDPGGFTEYLRMKDQLH